MLNRSFKSAIVVVVGALLTACAAAPDAFDTSASVQVVADANALLAEGDAATARGDAARAIELYERATALTPEQALPWFRLGSAYLRNSQAKPAQAALEKALKLDPESGKAQANLALAHLAQFREAAGVAIRSDQVSQPNRVALTTLLRDVDQVMFVPPRFAPRIP